MSDAVDKEYIIELNKLNKKHNVKMGVRDVMGSMALQLEQDDKYSLLYTKGFSNWLNLDEYLTSKETDDD